MAKSWRGDLNSAPSIVIARRPKADEAISEAVEIASACCARLAMTRRQRRPTRDVDPTNAAHSRRCRGGADLAARGAAMAGAHDPYAGRHGAGRQPGHHRPDSRREARRSARRLGDRREPHHGRRRGRVSHRLQVGARRLHHGHRVGRLSAAGGAPQGRPQLRSDRGLFLRHHAVRLSDGLRGGARLADRVVQGSHRPRQGGARPHHLYDQRPRLDLPRADQVDRDRSRGRA